MARNITIQVLRGVQANIPTLALGEMYFATDTGNLFFGVPGFGLGYVQIGDTTQVSEKMDQLVVLMEAVRRLLLALVCDGGKGANPNDFMPDTIAKELNGPQDVLS